MDGWCCSKFLHAHFTHSVVLEAHEVRNGLLSKVNSFASSSVLGRQLSRFEHMLFQMIFSEAQVQRNFNPCRSSIVGRSCLRSVAGHKHIAHGATPSSYWVSA